MSKFRLSDLRNIDPIDVLRFSVLAGANLLLARIACDRVEVTVAPLAGALAWLAVETGLFVRRGCRISIRGLKAGVIRSALCYLSVGMWFDTDPATKHPPVWSVSDAPGAVAYRFVRGLVEASLLGCVVVFVLCILVAFVMGLWAEFQADGE